MNRKISLGVAIALMSLAAAVAIVITAGYSMYDFNGRMQSLRESEVMYSKLNEIDGYVRQNFYGDIDEEELMNAVAKGYVSGLGDKYARYMTPEEYQAQMAFAISCGILDYHQQITQKQAGQADTQP